MNLSPSTNLGHYEILIRLGAGGMGEVYLAQDTRLNRKVALKVLPTDLINNRQRLLRFEREAQAASALNHPNILTIHEIGVEGHTHFMATEFIEGETLRQKLQTERLKIEETLNIAIQVAAALEAAHKSGIVHRDIKPENLMLREDGLVKVLDFGLAKLIEKREDAAPPSTEDPTLARTTPGTVIGTMAYMSPEQARGKEVDARTDIFSLGTVLYEMLTGRLPFVGETASDMIAAVLKAEPAPLDANTHLELQRIVRKSLQKNVDERYQTAKDLLIDLKAFKQEQDFTAALERFGTQTNADQSATTQDQSTHTISSAKFIASGIKQHKGSFAVTLMVLLLATLGFGYWYFNSSSTNAAQIESIAVLPFVNASGNTDLEYLSDGMTETLINNLSQLPHLAVKARSSVFRYKGKDVEPQQVASELSVQALVSGRVVQRGDDLTLYLSLVDARNGNQLWGEQYNRKLNDLVSLQSEIARDVSQKLRARLSGADERKVAKNPGENVEAYQLYLKGRYYVARFRPADTEKGISYLQQAIEIDPSYALAYVGLADAYRTFALFGDMPSSVVLPKSKAAALKAVELDDSLAEAHAVLGFSIYWYDWDWTAAETQFKRALELNPNSADAHFVYAALLSTLGRHAEAFAEIKRARELDPLNLRINTTEGAILIHAGQPDAGLAALQKTFELDPNYTPAHSAASAAYIEKGMYVEAVAEATKARELHPGSSFPIANVGYALAKSGKQAEARAALEKLLKLSSERYVPAYYIALVYNALGERDETLTWLERGFKERNPGMVFLKVDSKWKNLRGDPRFKDLLGRVGFPE